MATTLPPISAKATGIEGVFRCASADEQFGDLNALSALRNAAIESGIVKPTTPGGGLEPFALEIAAELADESERTSLRGLAAAIEVLQEIRAEFLPALPSSRPPTQDATTRRMDSRQGRLPPLVGSKPVTPVLQRVPLDLDDQPSQASGTTLPPITVYEGALQPKSPEGRPTSKQFRYRPQPTGEGLARVFACASPDSAARVNAGESEPYVGLLILHDAVKATKLSNPHRLVKMTATPQWHSVHVTESAAVEDAGPPRDGPLKGGRPPKGGKPLASNGHTITSNKASRYQDANFDDETGNQRPIHVRMTTADRIARRFEHLRADLSILQAQRDMRRSHNARIAALNKTMGSTFASSSGASGDRLLSAANSRPSETSTKSQRSAAGASGAAASSRQPTAAGALPGGRVRAPPTSAPGSALGSVGMGTLTTRPMNSAIEAVLESVKRQQSAATASGSGAAASSADSGPAADSPTKYGGGRSATIVPHRGVRASAAVTTRPVSVYEQRTFAAAGVLL